MTRIYGWMIPLVAGLMAWTFFLSARSQQQQLMISQLSRNDYALCRIMAQSLSTLKRTSWQEWTPPDSLEERLVFSLRRD